MTTGFGTVSATFCVFASSAPTKPTGSFGVVFVVFVFFFLAPPFFSPIRRRRCSAAMRRLNAPIFGVKVHSSSTYAALLLGLPEPAPACNRSVARRNSSPLNTNGAAAAVFAAPDARVVSSASFSLANDARVGRTALVGCREVQVERARIELPEGVVVRSPLPSTSSTELSLSSHNECRSSLSRLRASIERVALRASVDPCSCSCSLKRNIQIHSFSFKSASIRVASRVRRVYHAHHRTHERIRGAVGVQRRRRRRRSRH